MTLASLSLRQIREAIAEHRRYAKRWQDEGYPKIAMDHVECIAELFAIRHNNVIRPLDVEENVEVETESVETESVENVEATPEPIPEPVKATRSRKRK